MPNDWHAPGLAQDFLPLLTTHVLHICVVFGKSKNPGSASTLCESESKSNWFRWFQQFQPYLRQTRLQSNVNFVSYLSSSVIHKLSSLPFIVTGNRSSLGPCLIELDLVVMVLTLVNCLKMMFRSYI